MSKRRLVEDAVSHHLTDDGLVMGRVALTEKTADVLTAGEAAAMLRIDEKQLVKACERGEIPARKIGSDWRLSRPALLDWLRGDEDGSDRSPQADQWSQIPTSS